MLVALFYQLSALCHLFADGSVCSSLQAVEGGTEDWFAPSTSRLTVVRSTTELLSSVGLVWQTSSVIYAIWKPIDCLVSEYFAGKDKDFPYMLYTIPLSFKIL